MFDSILNKNDNNIGRTPLWNSLNIVKKMIIFYEYFISFLYLIV